MANLDFFSRERREERGVSVLVVAAGLSPPRSHHLSSLLPHSWISFLSQTVKAQHRSNRRRRRKRRRKIEDSVVVVFVVVSVVVLSKYFPPSAVLCTCRRVNNLMLFFSSSSPSLPPSPPPPPPPLVIIQKNRKNIFFFFVGIFPIARRFSYSPPLHPTCRCPIPSPGSYITKCDNHQPTKEH